MKLAGFIIVFLFCGINQSVSSFNEKFERLGSFVENYDTYTIEEEFYITKSVKENWAGAVTFCAANDMEIASVGPMKLTKVQELVNSNGKILV